MTSLTDKVQKTTSDIESITTENFALIEKQIIDIFNKSELIKHQSNQKMVPNEETFFNAISISSLFIQVVDLAIQANGHNVSAIEMAKVISAAFGIYADATYEPCRCNDPKCKGPEFIVESLLIDLSYGRTRLNS